MRTLAASTSAPDADRRAEAGVAAGRIGPNAAIQLIVALETRGESEVLARLFHEAGREAWLAHPPQELIPARDAALLHVGLRRLLPPHRAEDALAEAGRLTAGYLSRRRS
jgi:bacteriochlorophyll 4-vinyl reductase